MRHLINYMAAVALLLTAALPIQAQDENAAFYIYQNDGHFEGFFYDEVQKISYSKIDTLGVEHEDFVSQEIITADSTYRIMLSAIDSVGFVQPEIIFNPRLRDVRKEGLRSYISELDYDVLRFRFSSSAPDNLRPKEGDVLVDFDFEEGFSGKVRNVSNPNDGKGLLVECDPLESLKDVFYQFITVEQQDKDSHGQLVRRRVAGLSDMNIGDWEEARRRSSGDIDQTLLNFNFTGHIPFQLDPNSKLTFDAGVKGQTKIKGSYDIPWIGPFYIGITLQQDLSLSFGFTINASIDKTFSSTKFMPSIPVPAAAPIFELTGVPGLFIRGSANAMLSANFLLNPQRVWFKLEFNDEWKPTCNFGHQVLPELDKAPKTISGEADFNFGGFLQLGFHGPLHLGLNKWLKKVFDADVGTDIYMGPKLSGNLNVSIGNAVADGFTAYNMLKESKLTLTPLALDYETTVNFGKGMDGKDSKWKIIDGSVNLMGDDISMYLLPAFNKMDITQDSKGRDMLTIEPSRYIFFPVRVGHQIITEYPDGDRYDLETWENAYYYQWSDAWKQVGKITVPFSYTTPGEHRVIPLVRILGVTMKASPEYEFTVPGYWIRAPRKTVKIPASKDTTTYTIPIMSNAPVIKCKGHNGGNFFKDEEATPSGITISYQSKGGVLPEDVRYEIGAYRVEDGDTILVASDQTWLSFEATHEVNDINLDYRLDDAGNVYQLSMQTANVLSPPVITCSPGELNAVWGTEIKEEETEIENFEKKGTAWFDSKWGGLNCRILEDEDSIQGDFVQWNYKGEISGDSYTLTKKFAEGYFAGKGSAMDFAGITGDLFGGTDAHLTVMTTTEKYIHVIDEETHMGRWIKDSEKTETLSDVKEFYLRLQYDPNYIPPEPKEE